MRAFFFLVFFDMGSQVSGAAVWFLGASAASVVPGDRPPADNRRLDDHPTVNRTGRPRMRRGPHQPTTEFLVDDLPQVAANQHAPPGFTDWIDVVCFERDPRSVTQGVQHRVASSAECDLAVDGNTVDRQHEWLAVVDESNPPDDDTVDEAPANGLLEVVVVHDVLMFAGGSYGVSRLWRSIHRNDCDDPVSLDARA
jgi:hypothetical protein